MGQRQLSMQRNKIPISCFEFPSCSWSVEYSFYVIFECVCIYTVVHWLSLEYLLIIKTVCEFSHKQAFLDLGSEFVYLPMDKDKVFSKPFLRDLITPI